METLIGKICIIESSSARGSVDLDSLTNFPQVIMPPKFKAFEFARAFNKKVKPGNFKEGDLVLKVLKDETLIQEEKCSLGGLGLLSLRKSCPEVLHEL